MTELTLTQIQEEKTFFDRFRERKAKDTKNIINFITFEQPPPDFIPRFYSDDIIVFIQEFLCNRFGISIDSECLPIVDFNFVVTNALVKGIIRCWFKINSKIITINKKRRRILRFTKETRNIYKFFGFSLNKRPGQRIGDVLKLVSSKIRASEPMYEDENEAEQVFNELLSLTGLVYRRCEINIKDRFLNQSTEQDLDAIRHLREMFRQKINISSPFKGAFINPDDDSQLDEDF